MKFLLLLVLVSIVPMCLKAQDYTLGKSKNDIRSLIKTAGGVKLLKGTNSDTLSMPGGMKVIMLYKNDICYSSEAIMPLSFIDMVTQKMTHDSYRKIKGNEWISPNGKIKVDIKVLKSSNQFIAVTSQNKG